MHRSGGSAARNSCSDQTQTLPGAKVKAPCVSSAPSVFHVSRAYFGPSLSTLNNSSDKQRDGGTCVMNTMEGFKHLRRNLTGV